MEINQQAKAILANGQSLSNEINEAIRGVVISNAPAIERFHERHEELTQVNHLFLFYYSVSLILFFASSAGDWEEDETNSVIDRMSEEFVRALRFRAAAQDDPQGETQAIAAQLRSTFENVSDNFKRLGEIDEEKERSDATFSLVFMYLKEIHPASLTLLSEGNIAVVTALGQRFGLISMSAYRYVAT